MRLREVVYAGKNAYVIIKENVKRAQCPRKYQAWGYRKQEIKSLLLPSLCSLIRARSNNCGLEATFLE